MWENEAVLQELKDGITRRRALLITPLAFAGWVALSSRRGTSKPDTALEVDVLQFNDAGEKLGPARLKRVVRGDSEWRKQLSAEQFYVTRRQNTDAPYTGTYYRQHEPGLYRCVCCGNALFSSDAKFDSGTGWPSFWAPIAKENVCTHTDISMFMERVEVRCTLCDAHLGHIFDDGPAPTNLRYCINESSLRFIARGPVSGLKPRAEGNTSPAGLSTREH